MKLANRTMLVRGLRQSIWRDLNHRAMTASWPIFFASAAVIFVVFNLFFALLYALGTTPVANVPDGSMI